jgi:hypothetical protein
MLLRLPLAGAALLCALAALPAAASATTIPVTSTADGGPGTLRAVLATAGTGDVVTVPAGHYVLSGGILTVPGGVTLAGAGARATVIDGNHADGVITAPGGGVTVSDMTLTGGQSVQNGGGIHGNGFALRRVAVVGNSSAGSGGGVYAGGSPPVTIDHSLIAGNQATGGGGAYVNDTVASASIVDSTIVDNVVTGSGGGLYASSTGMLLDGDTLVGNTATGGTGGTGGNFRIGSNGTATMRNTIVAGGQATDGANCYLSGGAHLASLGHNVEDLDPHPDSDCQNALAADRTGLDLRLGALQDNGGPTDTILPAAGSPGVDAGDPAACLADDVRGVPRPQGAGCDVGAVERVVSTVGAAFADGLGATVAVLHGTADTAGLGGTAQFAYGPTAAYGGFAGATALPAAAGPRGAAVALGGLLPSTTYHFRLEVTTPDGLSVGPDATFTTQVPTPAFVGPGVLPPPPAPSWRVAVSKVTATATGATLTLACTGSAGATCRGTARLQTVERVSGKRVLAVSAAAKGTPKTKTTKKTATVGQKTYTLTAGGKSLKVTVALTKAARTLLTHFKRLPVRLAVTLTGSNGKTTTVSTSKALTIKPAKAKAKAKAKKRR